MRSLQEIVADNKAAAQQGYIEPGSAIGTRDVAVIRYNITRVLDGVIVATNVTLAEAAQYRNGINAGSYRLDQTSGPAPRSGGQRGSLTSGVAGKTTSG